MPLSPHVRSCFLGFVLPGELGRLSLSLELLFLEQMNSATSLSSWNWKQDAPPRKGACHQKGSYHVAMLRQPSSEPRDVIFLK